MIGKDHVEFAVAWQCETWRKECARFLSNFISLRAGMFYSLTLVIAKTFLETATTLSKYQNGRKAGFWCILVMVVNRCIWRYRWKNLGDRSVLSKHLKTLSRRTVNCACSEHRVLLNKQDQVGKYVWGILFNK